MIITLLIKVFARMNSCMPSFADVTDQSHSALASKEEYIQDASGGGAADVDA